MCVEVISDRSKVNKPGYRGRVEGRALVIRHSKIVLRVRTTPPQNHPTLPKSSNFAEIIELCRNYRIFLE